MIFDEILDQAIEMLHVYALSGQAAMAQPLLEEVLQQHDLVRAINSIYMLIELGAHCLLAGRLTEAKTWAVRLLQLFGERNERGHQAYALRLLGDIAMHHDSPEVESADTHYRQALALAEDLGMRPLQAHCHLGLGKLYGQTGQSERTRAELSTAIEMYRDMGMTFWLPETEAALAEVEGR